MAMTLDGTSGITQMTGSIVMSGSTSGTTTIIPSAVAGTTTVTMPAATGTMMVSGNMPAFSAYNGSNQSITSSTFTKVQLNTENFDTASAFDSTTNYRFTPQVAGYYQINGSTNAGASSSTSRVFASIYKNGSAVSQGSDISFNNGGASVSYLLYLNGSTDYIELYAYVVGVSPSLLAGSSYTYFQASLVRAA